MSRVTIARLAAAAGVLAIVMLGLAPSAWAADSTTTSVSCSPNPVAVSSTTQCTATVTDTSATSQPGGSVNFGGGSPGTFTGNPCALTASSANSSSCSVTYNTPSSAGPQMITATYFPSSAAWQGTMGSTTVAVGATSTTVSCAPNPVAVNGTTSCTATVTGYPSSGAPTGTVTFGTSGSGSFFSGNTCTLSGISSSQSQCSLGFAPAALGSQTITATYTPSGSSYTTSTGSTSLSVYGGSAVSQVACSPNPAVVNFGVTCTATVSGNSGNGAPSGTVSFSNNSTPGYFSGNPCTLASINYSQSQCSVSYTPTAAGTQTITATYFPFGGSPYTASAGSTTLTVNQPSASGPQNTQQPDISGNPIVGNDLFASTGQWSGAQPIAFYYQWQRCSPSCANIDGATVSGYTLTRADQGSRIRVLVAALNSGGLAFAVSSEVGPVLPSTTEIRGALLAALALQGNATIGAILSHDGYGTTFNAPQAGQLVASWYLSASGAARAARQILIARASVTFSRPRRAHIRIKLTPAGRGLLRHLTHVRLLAMDSFMPAGRSAVRTSRNITLRR